MHERKRGASFKKKFYKSQLVDFNVCHNLVISFLNFVLKKLKLKL